MSTLVEIEVAAGALPPTQQEELIRFLAARLCPAEKITSRARLVDGPDGLLLLAAAADAPPMTTESVKQLLEDFP